MLAGANTGSDDPSRALPTRRGCNADASDLANRKETTMPEPPAPSEFARKLASIAVEQHRLFHEIHETDEPLRSQIRLYWKTLGLDFPGVDEPWSAVFVSFCVK